MRKHIRYFIDSNGREIEEVELSSPIEKERFETAHGINKIHGKRGYRLTEQQGRGPAVAECGKPRGVWVGKRSQ